MTVSISTLPVYPVAGETCALVGTCSDGQDEDTEWSLTATPTKSRLALGQIVERHPTVARVTEKLTFNAAVARPEAPATITRKTGSFVEAGFLPGMAVDVTGSASNNKRVTLASVTASTLTLGAKDVLVAEVATASLLGAEYGKGGPATNKIVFDVPGEYTVDAYEVFRVDAIGAYPGDPLGEARREVLSTASATVYVGGYVELPIRPTNGHASTLRLLVVNDTVRGAALVSPATELARVAALDATVAAAVTALEGVAVNSLDVDFVTDTNTLCTKIAAHIILVGSLSNVHYVADTTNTLLLESANSLPIAIARLNEAASRFARGHLQATLSGGTWHAADDGRSALQVAPTATTLGEAVVLKADLRERVYEQHRTLTASPAAHANPDTTNVMDAPLPLPVAIVAYLDFIATNAPSAVAGESEGIADAQAAWGFRAA